ncbi:ABC transporter permease [Dyadobacter sp. CY107]|uniref:ABC transporter permease n=1 Tax=Dyadobacter fanqingshengii TaxID=2906443 RepID=UPI001F24FA29|nr:ABC transporter permease [Dyadobacter fanqingshengii]MCF2505313.1 ABC transporter permease [Dyadobacter fanqingshengii]
MNEPGKYALTPPILADKLLQWLLAPHLLETIQGDLHEEFTYNIKRVGARKARWLYWREVLGFLKPRYVKRQTTLYPSNSLISQDMIRNYFKIAFRNLVKYKTYSLINIAGLSLGLTACMLIGLFVWDENQYDKFLPDGGRIYRVYQEQSNEQGTNFMAVAPPMFATALQEDFPEVENTARVMMTAEHKTLFETPKNKLYEENGFFVDSTFFEVFALQFKQGSSQKALSDPSSIVISTAMAQRFFGNENPVGKQILMDKLPYQVKGVVENNPKFHLQFDFLVPIAAYNLPPERMQSWGWNQFYNYVKVKKATQVNALERKFQDLVKEKTKVLSEKTKNTGSFSKPIFQPLENIHLYSAGFKYDSGTRGNITYVNALAIIAAFILLIAFFNFVNLATAKSLQRAKEVGVRKAVGAARRQLIMQFTGEAMLIIILSAFIAICLATSLVPWLNDFTGKEIDFALLQNPIVPAGLLVLITLIGILAGFYPALVLSGFKPVSVLNGAVTSPGKPGKIPWLRHGFVIAQFTISVLLIISAIVVFRQVNYLADKDLGFNKEQIMFFPMRGDNMFKNHESFKEQLTRLPGVSSISIGYGFPGDAVAGDEIIATHNGEKVTQSATQLMVDHDYVKLLGLQIITGRDFAKEMKTDKDKAFIINETAVKLLGFETPEKAIGQTLSWHPWGATDPDSLKTGNVIGVVKDFNYKSLYDKVELTVLQIFPDAYWKVAVKVKTADINTTVENVQKVWNRFTPDSPIEYKFLDDNFQKMYQAEHKLRSLLWIFTGIAIFIGCLGLFGLSAYTAQQRTKEIGIRKVLGASVSGIVTLLSWNFLKLTLISTVIASPVAWYVMNEWLMDFAYRIQIEWWIFVLAGGLALLIAFFTISFQSIKSALMDPVRSLRSE